MSVLSVRDVLPSYLLLVLLGFIYTFLLICSGRSSLLFITCSFGIHILVSFNNWVSYTLRSVMLHWCLEACFFFWDSYTCVCYTDVWRFASSFGIHILVFPFARVCCNDFWRLTSSFGTHIYFCLPMLGYVALIFGDLLLLLWCLSGIFYTRNPMRWLPKQGEAILVKWCLRGCLETYLFGRGFPSRWFLLFLFGFWVFYMTGKTHLFLSWWLPKQSEVWV